MTMTPGSYGPAMERARPDEVDEEGEGAQEGSPRMTAEQYAGLFKKIGLFTAPLIIAALGLLLFWYYQSLNLDDPSTATSLRSPLSWSTKLWPQTVRIIEIGLLSTAIVIALAIPLGILLTRPALRRVGPFVLTVANSGQALPAYGLLVLFLLPFGQGLWTVVWALALYALLPVLRNTMVGLQGVDKNVIEAGRGMGMTKIQALTRIELPLAVPVILAGVRTAMILNIGMAALAFLIGGGGLGITINAGLKLNQDSVLIVGAGLMALIALIFDWVGAMAERFLRPKGI